MAITITTDTSKISDYGWDYPVSELEYLCNEHDGETFVLNGNRLFEIDESRTLEPYSDDEFEVYFDGVKADVAYCLGIEEGSDEWYELMDI